MKIITYKDLTWLQLLFPNSVFQSKVERGEVLYEPVLEEESRAQLGRAHV